MHSQTLTFDVLPDIPFQPILIMKQKMSKDTVAKLQLPLMRFPGRECYTRIKTQKLLVILPNYAAHALRNSFIQDESCNS